jgi:hypothetical protein
LPHVYDFDIFIYFSLLCNFTSAMMVAGFELSAQMDLRVGEVASSGILNTSAQIVGIGLIVTLGQTGLMDHSTTTCTWLIAVTMTLGAVACFFCQDVVPSEQGALLEPIVPISHKL